MMKSVLFASCCTTLAIAGGDIPIIWEDCSDETYKTPISALSPDHVTIGKTTTITGSGVLLEDITEELSFDGVFKIQLNDCTGDAATETKCNFPMDAGHITFTGMDFPVAAGVVPVEVDLQISKILPASVLNCTAQITAVSAAKGTVFCLNVETTKSPDSHLGVGILDVTWTDCGGSDALVTVDTLTPKQIKQGENTKFIGSGNLLEELSEDDVTFDMSISVSMIDCAGIASKGKKCNFPLGLGYLDFKPISSPVSAGNIDVAVDLKLSNLVPSSLVPVTTTHVTAKTASGENVFCLNVYTDPTVVESDVSV